MCACASMTNYFLYTCLIILIGELMSTHVWIYRPVFYQNNALRCNCESNAQCNEQDGICPRDKCARDYFGTNCQHENVSLAMTKNPTNVPSVLLDGDDTTCLTQYTGTAIFQTDKGVHFIWVYIFAENPITVKPTLTLRNPGDKNIKFNFLTLSSNSLLIKADRDVMYNKLEISNLPKDICSLEVSLGRNLALSSTPSGLSNVDTTMDGIDGKYPFEYQHGNNQIWEIRFLYDAIINHIQLIVHFSLCRHVTCSFTFKTNRGPVQMKNHNMQISQSIIVDLKETVEEMTFYSIPGTKEGCEVRLYEMYIFGEFQCPNDWYGERCERNCPDGCDRDICDPDWGCPGGCKNNWTGKWCDQPNTAPTTTATTTTVAATTTAAATTTSATTTNAATTTATTTAVDTTTTAAATTTTAISSTTSINCMFRFGQQCQFMCPGNCGGIGDCDRRTGACLQGCKAGFLPPNCTHPCPPGTFDVNCSRSCDYCKVNVSTGDRMCHAEFGTCSVGCENGYGGDDCEKLKVDDDTATPDSVNYILVAIGALGLIIVLHKAFASSNKEQESTIAEDEEEKRVEAGQKNVEAVAVDTVSEPSTDREIQPSESSTEEEEEDGSSYESSITEITEV